MAFSAVMTGVGQNCTLTSGSSSMVVSSATGLAVGATIQGTGIPTGSRIRSISGTTVVMETGAGADSNATAAGVQSLIFSSVWGSVLTISLSASGDTANVDAIFNAGFGVKQRGLATREIYFPGGLGVAWKNIVAGAIFDFQNWSLEFGSLGYWQFEGASILGEIRGGYLINGTQFIKTAGPTFVANNFNNAAAGGTNMFSGTNTGAVTGVFRMNTPRFIEQNGSNAGPFFASGRMNCLVDDPIFDYQNDAAGANINLGTAFGYIANPTIVKANAVIVNPNAPNIGTITGLKYVGIYTQTPEHKLSIPSGSSLEGYAPQVLSNQFLGGFSSGTLETYPNINLSTASWGLEDVKTKYQRFGGPITLQFPRTVNFEFNDSSAANLTGVTLYIRSGSTSIINAVQAGDYSALTQALNLVWATNVSSYRTCNSFEDTISQVARFRKYGFIEQEVSYSLNTASYYQPVFLLQNTTLSSISEATAAAITAVDVDLPNKVATVRANANYDQANARIAWVLAQTTGSIYADPRTVTDENNVLASGWSVVVMPGFTFSAGTNITYMYADTFKALDSANTRSMFDAAGVLRADGVLLPNELWGQNVTYTGTGKITALYGSLAGDSTNFEVRGIKSGASYIVANNSTKATILFGTNSTGTSQTYTVQFPPGSSGLQVFVARQNYGDQYDYEVITLTPGVVWYQFIDIPDEGISVPVLATVLAYTTIENYTKLYDRVCAHRTTEAGIKLGDIVIRAGTQLQFGNYSGIVKSTAASAFSITGSTITIKASALDGTTRFDTIVATPPATWVGDTVEEINGEIEDANGNSSVNIQAAAISTFEIWKITDATDPDDYATGALLTTVGIGKYRFLNADGFKMVIRDTTTNFRVVSEMEKGTYTAALFFGASVQLAQAAEVSEINNKVDAMQINITNIPSAVWNFVLETGYSALQMMRLFASVLLGKVSGAGTATETFRDINDTKNRVVADVTPKGDRTNIDRDAS